MMTPPTQPLSRAAAGAQRGVAAARYTVAELAAAIGVELSADGDGEAVVSGVQQDSRRVRPGDVFVALQGAHVDAVKFIPGAVERGAVAVLVSADRQRAAQCGLPLMLAEQPRRALAQAASLVYGEPTRHMCVLGLTGTNGKTTTAQLLGACLQGCGAQPAIAGTLGYRFGGELMPSGFTSPEADELQRVAADMLARGASHLVMEVSSIALAAERVAEVAFDLALFTNLTQDHLDFHGTMERYAAAKDRLFFEHAPPIAVINIDDAHGAQLARRLVDEGWVKEGMQLWRTSTSASAEAEVKALSVNSSIDGIDMQVQLPNAQLALRSPMLGGHNASNLLGALAAALSLGLDAERAATALASLASVDGRLERIDQPGRDEVVALVDYAHTPDALERTLQTLRALSDARLLCVFGCGGDRDRDKRAPMGRIAAERADVAIVTNDNPRSEVPETIAEAILDGVRSVPGADYRVELDRARAIALAVTEAQPGDIVLVAGKGHETYQIIGDERLDFDDREVVRAALARRRQGEGAG